MTNKCPVYFQHQQKTTTLTGHTELISTHFTQSVLQYPGDAEGDQRQTLATCRGNPERVARAAEKARLP